jgi:hypothetical protein
MVSVTTNKKASPEANVEAEIKIKIFSNLTLILAFVDPQGLEPRLFRTKI